MGERKGNGLTLEITDGITEHANRVALKGVFSAFGDVLACWVPPIDRRGVDNASVRFAVAQAAESAKAACDAGQVFFQGLPLKAKWRSGGGPRVGNSDIGGTVGGNSPTRRLEEGRQQKGLPDRERDRGDRGDRRRSRSRKRRRRSPSQDRMLPDKEPGGGMFVGEAPPALGAPQYGMPPDAMMQAMGRPPMLGGKGGMYPGGAPDMGGMPPGMGGMGGMPPGMGGMGMPPFEVVPEPMPPMPTPEEIEAEARKKREIQAKRAAQLKRGPGVAALVQGALKNAQSATVKSTYKDEIHNLDKEEEEERPKKTKQEIEEERKRKERAEAEDRARLEREALEREKEKARQLAEEKRREEERMAQEAQNREVRVKAGVEAAKKQQAQRERQFDATGKAVVGPENLYGDMPDAGMEPEDDAAEKRRKEEARRAAKNFNLPPEDITKVVFLDIDGVLRPARAGGFDIASDGKESTNPDTSDFFPSAMKALRHIIERTGACLVLSSEWRRNEGLRDAIDEVLESHRIRPSYATTPVNIEEIKSGDPVRSFADRRAREVSAWIREHEASVKGWVVLDDINLAIADEEKKSDTKGMGPKLVQTWPLCGLTMGNAKTAVRILNGEMIHKVLVERPKAPGGINIGVGAQGAATPVGPGR